MVRVVIFWSLDLLQGFLITAKILHEPKQVAVKASCSLVGESFFAGVTLSSYIQVSIDG